MSINKTLRSVILRSLTVAFAIILLLFLLKQQSDLVRLEKDCDQLREQNLMLLDRSLQLRQTPASTHQAPVTSARQGGSPSPAPHASLSDKNRLIFTGTDVYQTSTGLVAVIRFKPSKTGPLGLVAMSVRMPHESDAMIQTIQPVGSAKYDEGESSVSENGRFAFFQGTLGDEKDVAIALGISGSARVFVKGSCGITAMQLDIQPTKAIATPFGR